MLRGFWKLTWVEIKVFVREPLGVFGSLAIPVFIFPALGSGVRAAQTSVADEAAPVHISILAAPATVHRSGCSVNQIIPMTTANGSFRKLSGMITLASAAANARMTHRGASELNTTTTRIPGTSDQATALQPERAGQHPGTVSRQHP